MSTSKRRQEDGEHTANDDRLHSMITDTSGMSAMMFGEQPGRGVDLGDAVKTASQELVGIIEG